MRPQQFALDPHLEQRILSVAKTAFGLDLRQQSVCARIAAAVKQLSDFYIENPQSSTPWDLTFCQLAYLCYYLPLNSLRCQAVFYEASRFDFFKETKKVIDYGSGLGSASLTLQQMRPDQGFSFTFIEQALPAQNLHRQLLGSSVGPVQQWQTQVSQDRVQNPAQAQLGIFSYVLTELAQLPEWIFNLQQIVIIEPASSAQGRQLLGVRQQLLQAGYFAWAPCTHQQACPLLTHSQSDWCHDRIHIQQPAWLQQIEQGLPFKNATLPYSYLLASRQPAPKLTGCARTTGDLLREKGKSRQMICRGSEREYLSWLNRDGEVAELPRGTLVHWPEAGIAKGNEIRVQGRIEVYE